MLALQKAEAGPGVELCDVPMPDAPKAGELPGPMTDERKWDNYPESLFLKRKSQVY